MIDKSHGCVNLNCIIIGMNPLREFTIPQTHSQFLFCHCLFAGNEISEFFF